MLKIKRSTTPHYLRSGLFYQSLSADDDGEFEIPENCLKYVTSVESERDLASLFHSLRFWNVQNVPLGAFLYIAFQGGSENHVSIIEEFPEFGTYIIRALHVKGASPTTTMATAIREGFGIEAVRFLCWKNFDWSAECCEAAASVGDLECLMFLHTEGCPWDERTTTAAAKLNQQRCMQYALDFGCPIEPQIMQVAAKEGHIEILRILHAAGVPWDDSTMTAAVVGNKIECVRFLHAEGWILSPGLCHAAAFYGSFECLQYLHEEGGVALHGIAFNAARAGNLRCLAYAHEQGDTWDALCCVEAARGNHLPCLQCAREHGCPWDERTLIAAIGRGSWSCVKYAVRHRCPRCVTNVILFLLCMTIPTAIMTLFIHMRGTSFRIARIVTIVSPCVYLVLQIYGPEVACVTQRALGTCLCAYTIMAIPMYVYNLYGAVLDELNH